jgi:two-component system OmpR family response regulator
MSPEGVDRVGEGVDNGLWMNGPILIIDDEPDIRELIAYGLGRNGWVVETAGCGADALARLCGSRPSGIILDLVLPDIHGLGILETARQIWVEDPVPVIIISCLQTTELQDEAGAEGADAFLPKPFILEDLVSMVERLCRDKNQRVSPGAASRSAKRARGGLPNSRKDGRGAVRNSGPRRLMG